MDRSVFWLVPAAEFRKPLLKIITDLAVVHDAPLFAPHVTLGAAPSDDEAALSRMRERLIKTKPVELTSTGVQTGSEFTHSLYLDFAASRTLDELMAACPFPSGRTPHLSLLYCSPSQRDDRVCDAVEIPFEVIGFDEAWIVPMTGLVRAAEDVTRWQASERIRLSHE